MESECEECEDTCRLICVGLLQINLLECGVDSNSARKQVRRVSSHTEHFVQKKTPIPKVSKAATYLY